MLIKQGPYAGRVDYTPRTELDNDTIRRLSRLLVDAGAVEEPENPAVVIDWYLVERDHHRRPIRQAYIVLLRNGGDAETPACIFYRCEIDRLRREERRTVHIPPPEAQPALTSAWQWWSDPGSGHLEELNAYLDRLLEDESAWEPYE